MNCIASALCLLCWAIDSVCGSAAWSWVCPLSGGSITQPKPDGACSTICCAAYEPCIVIATLLAKNAGSTALPDEPTLLGSTDLSVQIMSWMSCGTFCSAGPHRNWYFEPLG